ncbi:MAG TPA: ABC transporter permease [Myxococcota bacterium]|nr:ABC transporter permease [Myxococcota bacterium]
MLRELVRLALRSLRRNALRSALTMLGIVIGVAAVIAMVTMGAGVTREVQRGFAQLGTNLLLVRPGASHAGSGNARANAPDFTLADVETIEREVPEAVAVAPVDTTALQVIAGDRNRLTNVMGSGDSFLRARAWKLASGRTFSEGEERAGAAVCVLGSTVARDLFGGEDPQGHRIRLGSRSCLCVGSLEAKGASGFGSDQDDFVLVPLRWYQRQISGGGGGGGVHSIYVAARDDVSTARLSGDVAQLLRQRRHVEHSGDDFTIRDMTEVAAAAVGTTRALTRFLGALAAVSMGVGGIGIMNIMLVSVTERTREIGIRLAVGALERDVQRQFLVEAAVLASLGGVVGIALGLVAALLGAHMLEVHFVFEPGVVVAAFLISGATGLAFGYYPARRAARQNPIEALSYE